MKFDCFVPPTKPSFCSCVCIRGKKKMEATTNEMYTSIQKSLQPNSYYILTTTVEKQNPISKLSLVLNMWIEHCTYCPS